VRVYGSMSAPQSFRYYYWQFLKEFAVDATPWARDNMILAGTMAVIPGIAVYWVDRSHSVDWPVIKTTLWLYGGALLIYLGIHMVRTPWKLNRRHIAEIQEAKDRETVLLKQIEELTPKQSIRQQTFSLAESVLNFAYQRSSGAPHPPAWTPFLIGGEDPLAMLRRSAKESHLRAEASRYQTQTLGMYEYQFARKVVALLTRLKDTDVDVVHLPGFWTSPASNEQIILIGHSLMQIADQLPHE